MFVCCAQVAQQEAQMAQYIVEKAKQERQQKVVQAEGEAKSATLVSCSGSVNVCLSVVGRSMMRKRRIIVLEAA